MSDQEDQESSQEEKSSGPTAEEIALQESKLAEAEEKARVATEARIRAEAERDTIKTLSDAKPQQVNQISEEQWAAIEADTGMTRKAYMANASVAQQIANQKTEQYEKKLALAEEKSRKAEERLARLEAGLGSDSTKRDFYAAKPALARYKADVDEFLSDYPDSMKNDPKELSRLLVKAETYVKGKVGDKMRTEKGPKFGGGGEEMETNEIEVDTSDLQPLEASLVRSLVKSQDEEKKIKEVASVTRHGVSLGGEREWNEVRSNNVKQFGKF